MPSESEHRLDAPLRAWAKKRREEAGKGFELHPATRRLLLDEVKRSFPEREREREPWRLVFGRAWTRTVGVVGFVAVLAVVGWAAKNLWTNLPRVGDMAMDDANPPEQFDFTLRKRQAEETNSRMLATKNEFGFSRQELAKEAKPASAASQVPNADAKQKATAVADKSIPDLPIGFGRQTAPSSRSGSQATAPSRRGNASDPFGIIPPIAGGVTNRPFSPLGAPELATGGIAALTEILARKESGRPPQARQTGATARDSSSDLARLDQSPRSLQLRSLPTAPAATAPQPSQLGVAAGAEGAALSKPAREPGEVSALKPVSAASRLTELTTDKQMALAVKKEDDEKVGIQNALASAQSAQLKESAFFVNQAAPTPVAAPAEPSPAPTGDSYYFARLDDSASPAGSTDTQSTVVRSIARGAAVGGARYVARARSASILSRFELRQQGSSVTLLDADGSVYQGEFATENRPGSLPAPAPTLSSAQKLQNDLKSAASATGSQELDSVSQLGHAMPARPFQVAGTNRSLNQPVVIIATLVAPVEDTSPTATLVAPATRPARPSTVRPAAPSPASLSRGKSAADANTNVFRIQGRIRIGAAAEESLDAVRTR